MMQNTMVGGGEGLLGINFKIEGAGEMEKIVSTRAVPRQRYLRWG